MEYQLSWVIQCQTILVEELYLYYSWEVRNFPEGISSKTSVIMRLEFELAYNDITVQHVSHMTRGVPLML